MFQLGKKKEQFILEHSASIRSEKIEDTEQLINYVIGVNNELIDRDQTGWITIKKIKQQKKGEVILYGLRIELPLLEDNPYFSKLLEPFYTKKPIPYDESSLTEEKAKKVVEKAPQERPSDEVDPPIPEELQKLMVQNQELKQEQVVESTVEEDIEEESSQLELLLAEQQQRINQLEYALHLKSEKLKELEKTAQNSEKEFLKNSLDDSKEYSVLIEQFIKHEIVQIKEKVGEMDRREQLKEEITNQFKINKQAALKNKLIELEAEMEIQRNKAEEEYKKQLAAIETQYEEKKESELSVVTIRMEENYQEELKRAYQQQEEQIKEYLEQKKEELSGWKQKINLDLEAQFTAVSSSFFD